MGRVCVGHCGERRVDGFERADLRVRVGGDHLLDRRLGPAHLRGDHMVERRELLEHTPRFFNVTAVPFDYEKDASEPSRWFGFLHDLWGEDADSVKALQEFFGYVVSGRLDMHKILLVVGPTRAGKGVIARTLTALVGPDNVAGPTLSSLGGEFGLAPLLGKPLAIVSDARLSGRGSQVVVERLLAISGEDTITVKEVPRTVEREAAEQVHGDLERAAAARRRLRGDRRPLRIAPAHLDGGVGIGGGPGAGSRTWAHRLSDLLWRGQPGFKFVAVDAKR
jgi:hypothetical protein